MLVEEGHVIGTLLQRVLENPLEEPLAEVHVVGQLVEGHFGLDHPELGEMTRGIAVLGAKGGAEGVDFAERAGEDFAFELAADGEIGGLAEEIECVIDLGAVARKFFQVERRNAEHGASAFAVAGGGDRRVKVEKTVFLEEIVDAAANTVANAGDGAEGVGAWAKMGPFAELFQRVLLFLERIRFWIGTTQDAELFRQDFSGLPLATRSFDFSL